MRISAAFTMVCLALVGCRDKQLDAERVTLVRRHASETKAVLEATQRCVSLEKSSPLAQLDGRIAKLVAIAKPSADDAWQLKQLRQMRTESSESLLLEVNVCMEGVKLKDAAAGETAARIADIDKIQAP